MMVQASWEATRGSNNQARPRHGRRYYHHGHPPARPWWKKWPKATCKEAGVYKWPSKKQFEDGIIWFRSRESSEADCFFLPEITLHLLTTNRMGIGALLTIIILDSAYPWSSPSFKHPLTTKIANLQILISAYHPHHRSSTHLQLQLQICKS